MWRFPARAAEPRVSDRCQTISELRIPWVGATLGCVSPSLTFLSYQLLSFSLWQISWANVEETHKSLLRPMVSDVVCRMASVVFQRCLGGGSGGSVEPILAYLWACTCTLGCLGIKELRPQPELTSENAPTTLGRCVVIQHGKPGPVSRARNWKADLFSFHFSH